MGSEHEPGAGSALADPIAGSPIFPAGSRINERGRLEIAGATSSSSRPSSGRPPTSTPRTTSAPAPAPTSTPSRERTDDFEVLYASKAMPLHRRLPAVRRGGASGRRRLRGRAAHGALAPASTPARIYMHGNNKSEAEILAGARGRDRPSDRRLVRRDRALRAARRRAPPGGSAADHARASSGTHETSRTGQEDSKFGIGLDDGAGATPWSVLGRRARGPRPPRPHRLAGLRARACTRWRSRSSGAAGDCAGWSTSAAASGSPTPRDQEPPLVDGLCRGRCSSGAEARRGARILVEPGRSLVANPGVTAYTVGTVKESPESDLRRRRRRHGRQPQADALRGRL